MADAKEPIALRRLEAASRRLGAAVERLERAAVNASAGGADRARLVEALAEARAAYAALEDRTSQVAHRLDATIDRLDNVLGP